ncbi:glutamate ABC transporter substrate-binding protein [Bombiscardovia nodaiensis]|uniref:Glutamate ABC transporter substrate-binding protein n=1 Tax=Bombiscardovia nodaiensis TaxID=2932181 RepID=A0ABN6SD61_9BIFI|nr:glutamate ABC transporter substrate-binding protein [Bombiscardovia nodaiensis]
MHVNEANMTSMTWRESAGGRGLRVWWKTLLAALCAFACMFSLAACGSDKEAGKIRIGIKFDQPGLGFKKSGTYVGFDVDVAKYIAKKLGYSEANIIWKEAPSKQREAMLQNGDVDLVIATYSMNAARKKAVTFAGPYFVAGQDLMVRKGDTAIKGPDDLDGKRLCSVTGSTSAVTIKERYSSKVQLMQQPGYAECATALFSGIVDAVTTDDIILAGLASASRGRLTVLGKPFTQESYGVGIKKGDHALARKVDDAIRQMEADGSWQRAVQENTRGTSFKPDPKYNPPVPTEGEQS